MTGPDTAAWAAFQAAMAEAETAITAEAPDDATRTEGLAYLARLYASALQECFQREERTIGGLNYGAPKIGGANPDYRIGQAALDPKGRYRITGRVNDAARVAFGIYSIRQGGGLDLDSYAATRTEIDVAADGSLSLAIGAGESGRNGLALLPASSLLLVRELHLRPGEQPAVLQLERIDTPSPTAAPRAPGPEDVANSLNAAKARASGFLGQFLRWSRTIAHFPNTVTPLDAELDRAMRGDPDTRYCTGYFDLDDDQVLLIDLPEVACDYWAIQLVSHWLEPLPTANLNHATATPGKDGKVMIAVAPRDPGLPNWLDTGGRRRGAIFYRTVGAKEMVVPSARLIALR